ncbi:MAG: GGDEF domain-containing protein [Planctomycetes bacterium]|nr:GGDEF domain-containing protein [Planctomycetota bacterium]
MPSSIAVRGVLLVALAALAVGGPMYGIYRLQRQADAERHASSAEAFLAVALATYLDLAADATDLHAEWAEQLAQQNERVRWAGVFRPDGEGLEFRRRVSLPRESIVEQIAFDALEPTFQPLIIQGEPSQRFLVFTVPQAASGLTLAAILDLGEPARAIRPLAVSGLCVAAIVGLLLAYAWFQFGIMRPIRALSAALATVHGDLAEAALDQVPPHELREAMQAAEQIQRELKKWRSEAGYLRHSVEAQVDAKTRRAAVALRQAEIAAEADPLTGLRNRRAMRRILPGLFSSQREAQGELTLALLDIDNFKPFNDTCGHRAGDALLAFTGELLRATLRKNTDVAVRYGGDEFVLLLPDTTVTEATAIVRRMTAMFAQRVRTLDQTATPPSVSVGIAARQEHEIDSWEELLRRADEAMYHAKRRGQAVATWADVGAQPRPGG